MVKMILLEFNGGGELCAPIDILVRAGIDGNGVPYVIINEPPAKVPVRKIVTLECYRRVVKVMTVYE